MKEILPELLKEPLALATFGLVILTGVYVCITSRILKANQKQIESLIRPYINIRAYIPPARGENIYLEIKNTGKTPAYHLRLELDKEFYQNNQELEQHRLKNFEVFKNINDCWSPETILTILLGNRLRLYGSGEESPYSPFVFSVKALYDCLNKSVEEKTTIDLRVFFGHEVK